MIFMTVHLLTLAFIGGCFVLFNYFQYKILEFDNKYTPFYGLIVSLWVIFIIKNTYRRNKGFAKIWNTNNFE